LNRIRGKVKFINAEAEKLPLANNSVEMVYSNLTVQWVNDLDLALREFNRVLKPGGMLLFSTFGPDTLKELRDSWRAIDQYSHVNQFIDMHDIGDAMMRARLAEPVMDVENFTLTYNDVMTLMRDLKAIGAHNVTSARAKGLMGKTHFKQFQQRYEKYRQDGVLPTTYEVVYGHAWKAQQPKAHSENISIPLDSLKR
jgi:malonyl-CoA O-methyltransferase